MTALLLFLNAGSSSLGLAANDAAPELRVAIQGGLECDSESVPALAQIRAASDERDVRGVGHRAVHDHHAARVDAIVLRELSDATWRRVRASVVPSDGNRLIASDTARVLALR